MLSKSQIGLLRSLHEKKGRLENQLFMVEGEKMVEELFLSNFNIRQVYINNGVNSDSLKNKTKLNKIVEWVELGPEEMKKISFHPNPPSIMALVQFPMYNDENNINKIKYPALVLDDIQDPGNLGTLIRIADWFNFKTLITSKGSALWHNPKVIQASMGSFLRIPVLEWDIEEFLTLSNKIVYGARVKGISIYQEKLREMDILVLGNESKGISAKVENLINRFISIPSRGMAESLNVAIAGGIICSERSRQMEEII